MTRTMLLLFFAGVVTTGCSSNGSGFVWNASVSKLVLAETGGFAAPSQPTADCPHEGVEYTLVVANRMLSAWRCTPGSEAPRLAVPLSGVLAIAGGLGVMLGYQTRLSACVLVAFLVLVTLMMHAFWTLNDPVAVHTQQAMFMKNVALLGTALLLVALGSGPLSLDARMGR